MNLDHPDEDKSKRSQILKVASDLFAAFGFKGVSTRKIAEIAHCNQASISYYFGGKKRLYTECLSALDPDAFESLKLILKRARDREEVEEKLLQFCESFAEFSAQNSASITLLINEINSGLAGSEEELFLHPIAAYFENFLLQAQEDKIINPAVNATIISRMVISVIVSQISFRSFKSFINISNKEFARKIVGTCTSNFYLD